MSGESRKPPWMTADEWVEWEADSERRHRDFFERVTKMQAEREERQPATESEQQPPRRRRLFGLL
jgi:hypothetical protein